MKNLFSLKNLFKSSLVICFLSFGNIQAQQICATPPAGCASTDYSNYGINSDTIAATIEYDNMVSGFHATLVRNSDGTYSAWGQNAAYQGGGTNHLLSPLEINSTNYPGLTGQILRVSLGSEAGGTNANVHQFIILTTHNLFT